MNPDLPALYMHSLYICIDLCVCVHRCVCAVCVCVWVWVGGCGCGCVCMQVYVLIVHVGQVVSSYIIIELHYYCWHYNYCASQKSNVHAIMYRRCPLHSTSVTGDVRETQTQLQLELEPRLKYTLEKHKSTHYHMLVTRSTHHCTVQPLRAQVSRRCIILPHQLGL